MVSEKSKKRKVSRTGKPCAFEGLILYFGWGQVLASFIEIVADGFLVPFAVTVTVVVSL